MSAVIIEDQVRIPDDISDLDKFRAWAHSDEFPERGRISYIGGEIEVDMSPEELETHNKVKGDLFVDLVNLIRQHNLGELLPDGALLVNTEAMIANEPDMTFCSWLSFSDGRVRYAGPDSGRKLEVLGSPDMVVEIVSRSSVRKDTVRLRKRYYLAGIAEYWLIDARGPEVDFQILVRGESEYEAAVPDGDGFRRSGVFERSFRLIRHQNPVGGWAYRLQDR